MKQIENMKQYAATLRLGYLSKNLQPMLHQASIDTPGYTDFLDNMLVKEIEQRQFNDYRRRTKLARLPRAHDLDEYDHKASSSIGNEHLQAIHQGTSDCHR